MKLITWLISLFNREKEKMSDQSVTDTAVADATTVAATGTTATTSTADTTTGATTTETASTGIVAAVEHDLGQFYDIVKELTERFGSEFKELAIDFAKAVSVKK